jgi:chitinase
VAYTDDDDVDDGLSPSYNITQYQDEGDILVFNSTWVSWLSPDSYADRRSWYDGLHLGGSVDWAIDLNVSYSGNGTGSIVDTDADADWPDLSCPNTTFAMLEDLQQAQASLPDYCIPRITLETLVTMLDTAYANYSNVNNGYDEMFGYYTTYMMKLVPEILADAFMWNMSTTGENALVPNVGYGMLRKSSACLSPALPSHVFFSLTCGHHGQRLIAS